MRKNYFFLLLVFVTLMTACNNKKDSKTGFFPVLSFIQSQVAHVDTSLYSIMKLTVIDSTRTDTTYIRREDFRMQAKDFLDIPDLTLSKFKKRYSEKSMYDETLGRVVLTCLPEDPEKENLQRQEVMITPSAAGDRVHSIFLDYISNTRDSSVQKKMLWRVDQSFQLTVIKQKPGQPETISTTKVTWNEPPQQ